MAGSRRRCSMRRACASRAAPTRSYATSSPSGCWDCRATSASTRTYRSANSRPANDRLAGARRGAFAGALLPARSGGTDMSIAETIIEDEPAPAPAPAAVAMLQLIGGFYISRALFVTAKLRIADLLRYGPKDSEELAEATATHGPSLKRMLRALGSIGVFVEDEEERFSLTPLGHMLETDRPDSLGDLAILALGEESYWGWGNLMHSIRTGETAFDRIYDMSMWDYLGRHPESART